MHNGNLALGFYQNPETAKAVLRQLRISGYVSSASIYHRTDGQYVIDRSSKDSYSNFLIGLIAVIAVFLLAWIALTEFPWAILPLTLTVLAGLWWFFVKKAKVSKNILQQFKKRILPHETLVIAYVQPDQIKDVFKILRKVESGHPVSFLLRPFLYASSEEKFLPREPLSSDSLQNFAQSLAVSTKEVYLKSKFAHPLKHQLKKDSQILATIRVHIAEAEQVEQIITTSGNWLLDNMHVIQTTIEEVQRNLPRKYYQILPKLKEGTLAGYPRIYALAKELIANTSNRLTQENIDLFLRSYQMTTPLTIGELWALPLMLRLCLIECITALAIDVDRRLIERETASYWGNRLLGVRKNPELVDKFLEELIHEHPIPTPYFAEELIDHLFDEENILIEVKRWLETYFNAPIADTVHQEQIQESLESVAFSNAIVSLITLSQITWSDLFTIFCPVDAVFRGDQVYTQLNFATQNSYRQAIEMMARYSTSSEIEVAKAALALAEDGQDPVTKHIGYYLIDKGRPQLEKSLDCHLTIRQRLTRAALAHSTSVYLGSVLIFTLLIEGVLLERVFDYHSLNIYKVLLALAALFPASELAVQIVNLIVVHLLPPDILPKMSYEEGIPSDCKTLVVMPTLLSSVDTIKENLETLEIYHLANPDSFITLGLFADFKDAPQAQMDDDEELLKLADQGIEDLQKKYGEDKFFLFHRKRIWAPQEKVWMGWERKRGKLEYLNHFLNGETLPENIVYNGNPHALQNIRYVITLDADTQMPKGKARELIETISHPLNSPRISAQKTLERGYSIIQPRVSTHFSQDRKTLFSRIFADIVGIDPYTQAVSDVYQDLTHEGSYHGKGIYDVKAFHTLLSGRLPDEHILSHDLLEGAYAGVGFASDVTLFDSFPDDYYLWTRRQHRWMRGDWQLLDWIFPKIPAKNLDKIPNPLSVINRWKILDNLRRSLAPVMTVGLLVGSWLAADRPELWTFLVLILITIPSLSSFFFNSLTYTRAMKSSWTQLAQGLLRALINLALLPQQAWLSLDAIGRVLYRRTVSHQHFLEWASGPIASYQEKHRQFILSLSWITLFSALVAVGVYIFNAPALPIALPFLFLWATSPFLVFVLDDRQLIKEAKKQIPAADKLFIRYIARQTWRFFDDFVGPQSHWLPPDNYQAALTFEIAQRTSPTNIGLSLLSTLSAYDLRYITLDDCIIRVGATLQTTLQLELFEGHLYNWYDTQTLKPLPPRYVSSVDSGNLLACLWTLEQALEELMNVPLLPLDMFKGIQDTLAILEGDSENPQLKEALQIVKTISSITPNHTGALLGAIQTMTESIQGIVPNFDLNDPQYYGLKKLQQELAEWTSSNERYLGWMELLLNASQEQLTEVSPHAKTWREQALHSTPSLESLYNGSHPKGFAELMELLEELPTTLTAENLNWLQALKEKFEHAKWLAAEKLAQMAELSQQTHALADNMNLRFLYNEERKLFAIGYHVEDRRLDASYYDLLVSEARITSLVAIAKGEVPVEHWWALGRAFHVVNGRQVMVSWGGTMFEYLMPLLFTHHYEDSVLDTTCRAAVACQIDYGNKRGIPWGISESAYSDIDAHRTYQYRSFGVPGLGFKRDLEEDLVVSPYSTALALEINSSASLRNLVRLKNGPYSLLGDHGYYEAIDFTRQQDAGGERGVKVYAFMAHHQGMSLIAFNNALNDNVMPNRFHRDPRICGVESLLYESTPINPPIAKGQRRRVPLSRLTPFTTIPVMGVTETPNTTTPKVNLLSNNEYSLMFTNSGGGYSRWKQYDITRWRADTTCDAWGKFCYVKDLHSGLVWSTTYHPTLTKGQKYSVSFKTDRIEVRKRDLDIEILTEIVVSSQDNAEIQLMTFANLSTQPRHLELTTYCELVLAPHLADRAHPAFNKLFIETEALPEQKALLAFRRLRAPDEDPVFAAQVITSDQETIESLQFETDRARFIGRGRTMQFPIALGQELSNTVGTVLDPVFSLRRRLTLAPGQRVKVAVITMAASNREEILALVKKYSELSVCKREFDLSWNHAQLELRHLRIHQEEVQLFQKLASRILYPHAQLRPSSHFLRRNVLGQSHLWAYGISGDLPIVAVAVDDVHEIDLIKQIIVAHAFWKMRGLKVDLVILNEEVTGYEHPLSEQLQRIIYSQPFGVEIGKPGGIFLLNTDQMPEADETLIIAVARVYLLATRGTLRQQLVSPVSTPSHSAKMPPKRKQNSFTNPELPKLELAYYNSFGGFTLDGKEYVIELNAAKHTPTPWINVIANAQFGTIVSESGLGACWYGNSQSNRLTTWSNDPILNPITDALYIRDDESNVTWTPTPAPLGNAGPFRVRHGQGYSRFEHISYGIEQDLLVFVPIEPTGHGLPMRIQRLRLKNTTSQMRVLSVFSYTEWVLGTDREHTQVHIQSDWDPESQALLAHNPYNPDFGSHVAFAYAAPHTTSYTADRAEFIGRNRSSNDPEGLLFQTLSGTTGAALDPCAALQTSITLKPGEQIDLVFTIGYASDSAEARKLLFQTHSTQWVEEAFNNTCAYWDKLLGKVHVETPDQFVDIALNRWLLYQNLSCRIWGRSAFYQSSGAFGFRDQLQDSMALLYAAPQISRELILQAAGRQFVEGDVQHWWHPPSNAGVRTRITDDLLWLTFVTAQYVRVTQDTGILQIQVPFLKGELLKEHQHEAYFVPEISDERASLLEHCRRAIRKSAGTGPHGLPLIGIGDWNDGMNRVGIEGKGESVWLAWFLIHVMNDFADLLAFSGQSDGEGFRAESKRIAETVEKVAWDGNWYVRAFFDDGTPLGSHTNTEDYIDSLPQTWAVISGAADPTRITTAMNSLEQHLVLQQDKLVLLLTTPFNKSPMDPGYIKGYPPGVRENGGQYTHGSLWVPLAFARQGQGDKAYEILKMMHPIFHALDGPEVSRYKVEPYAVAADVYSLSGHVGRGGWTWYTGSSSWMYRIWIEEILGLVVRGTQLSFNPTLPSSWKQAKLTYHYHSTTYEVVLENPDGVCRGAITLELDGQELSDKVITMVDDSKVHQVKVTLSR